MPLFCEYGKKLEKSLGKVGEGIHSYRFMNIAIVDFIGTIVIALIISFVFNISAWKTIVTAFILGIIAHHLFCVRTTVDKLIFG